MDRKVAQKKERKDRGAFGKENEVFSEFHWRGRCKEKAAAGWLEEVIVRAMHKLQHWVLGSKKRRRTAKAEVLIPK